MVNNSKTVKICLNLNDGKSDKARICETPCLNWQLKAVLMTCFWITYTVSPCVMFTSKALKQTKQNRRPTLKKKEKKNIYRYKSNSQSLIDDFFNLKYSARSPISRVRCGLLFQVDRASPLTGLIKDLWLIIKRSDASFVRAHYDPLTPL